MIIGDHNNPLTINGTFFLAEATHTPQHTPAPQGLAETKM